MSGYVEATIRLERDRILRIAARVLRPTEYDLLCHAVTRPTRDLSTSEGQAAAIRAAVGPRADGARYDACGCRLDDGR